MIVALLLAAAAADPAASGLRDLCPDRPGRLTPACIVDAGHLLVETGAIDFIHDAAASGVTDTTTVASTLVRFGVTDTLEGFAMWNPYLHKRVLAPGGPAATTDGIGDVTFGLKRSLLHPDGKGFSLAVQPFVVAPTAPAALGNGGWEEGLVVPLTLDLPADFALGLSPEVDRLPNNDGGGHHVSYTMTGGVSRQLGAVNAGIELAAVHDDDPTRRTTQLTGDVFLAWVPKKLPSVQVDTGASVGLNRDTPDVEVFVGVAKRF